MMEQWSEPGAGAPAHRHLDAEEVLLVSEGRMEICVDGEGAVVDEGSAVVVPPGAVHWFANAGEGSLHTWAIFSAAAPATEYLDELGTVVEVGGVGKIMRGRHRAVRPDSVQ